MKNNFLGILLICCLVLPGLCTFIVLKHQKKQVKKEVKWKIIAGINKSELVLLRFSEKEKQSHLKWKHTKEFEYNDEMYDIVETETKGDTTYYWCWWDHTETKLNKELDNLVALALGSDPQNQESKSRLFRFFKSLYFSDSGERKAFTFQETKGKYLYWQNFYQSVYNCPPVPPPEIA